MFWVNAAMGGDSNVVGYATTDTLSRVGNFLLEKPGGFLSNDIGVPGVFLDNMPNFEFGVLFKVFNIANCPFFREIYFLIGKYVKPAVGEQKTCNLKCKKIISKLVSLVKRSVYY